jgi:hypothetical protein
MTEREKPSLAEYAQEKMEIVKKVNAVGPVGEMDSWKKAFPYIEFPETVYSRIMDETLYGKDSGEHEYFEVKWNERSVEDKVFFVEFQEHLGEELEVKYEVVVGDELVLTQTVDDSEVLWYMWIDGCFSGEELTEEALRDFVGVMTDSHLSTREVVDDADIADVRIKNIEIRVVAL